MNKIKFYQNNKTTNPIFLSIWIATCVVVVFLISYFYSFFNSMIPIIYFCLVVTVMFGTTIGYLVRFSSKFFVITNKKTIYIISLVCSTTAIYFSWLAYILQLNPNSQELYYTQPKTWVDFNYLFTTIIKINEIGLWGILGVNLTDWPLTLIWLGEIIILTLIPLALVKGYNLSPHSSRLNKWYKKYELNKQFQTILSIPSTLEKIAKNSSNYVENLNPGEINRHSIIQILHLENEGPQYISLINFRLDKEGKIVSRDIVIENQEIAKK